MYDAGWSQSEKERIPPSKEHSICNLEHQRCKCRKKLNVITNEMTRLNISIMGIAAHWMLGQGGFTLDDEQVKLYAGNENEPGRRGMEFILDKEAARSIMGYNTLAAE